MPRALQNSHLSHCHSCTRPEEPECACRGVWGETYSHRVCRLPSDSAATEPKQG